MRKVRAIFCSDMHLSHKAPLLRSQEPDWYEAMKRTIGELHNLKAKHGCPIFFAGDLFDRWNSPAELINFAIKTLPLMISIPGQHDLPNHRLDQQHRSAYHSVWLALWSQYTSQSEFLSFDLFPYNRMLKKCNDLETDSIAICHQFCWKQKHTYSGAPSKNHATQLGKQLKGYKVAVFGDNHDHFIAKPPNTPLIVNCGCMMRRSINELKYEPSVVLLRDDFKTKRIKLDTSKDVYISPDHESHLIEAEKMLNHAGELIAQLKNLGDEGADFSGIVKQYLEQFVVRAKVKEFILKALEE